MKAYSNRLMLYKSFPNNFNPVMDVETLEFPLEKYFIPVYSTVQQLLLEKKGK